MCPRTDSPATPPRDEGDANLDDRSLDDIPTAGLARLTDEKKAQEDIDCSYEDILPSMLPSSSPPQLFSSSPYASSQSSVGDVEPSKTV